MGKQEILQYQPQGVCCQMMQVAVEDNKIVDAAFFGGCNGNLSGIRELIKGMTIDEVKTYGGTGSFIGYTYLLSHKK